MKKNMSIINFRYGFLVILLAICMLFLGIYIGSHRMASVEAQKFVQDRQKRYTCIDVEEGDTLWKIAGEFMTEEYQNRDMLIEEIREMNHITGSMIRAGSTLLIPYYGESSAETVISH